MGSNAWLRARGLHASAHFPRRLRPAIANALGLETSTTPINGPPGGFRLGTWGVPMDVSRSRSWPSRILRRAFTIRSVVSSSDMGMIIVTPTAQGWSDELRNGSSPEGCARAREDVLDASGSGLIASDLWRLSTVSRATGSIWPPVAQGQTQETGGSGSDQRSRDGVNDGPGSRGAHSLTTQEAGCPPACRAPKSAMRRRPGQTASPPGFNDSSADIRTLHARERSPGSVGFGFGRVRLGR